MYCEYSYIMRRVLGRSITFQTRHHRNTRHTHPFERKSHRTTASL